MVAILQPGDVLEDWRGGNKKIRAFIIAIHIPHGTPLYKYQIWARQNPETTSHPDLIHDEHTKFLATYLR
jgi:hypothetical protein